MNTVIIFLIHLYNSTQPHFLAFSIITLFQIKNNIYILIFKYIIYIILIKTDVPNVNQ